MNKLDDLHANYEEEANLFAVYLLVPDVMLEKELRRKRYDLTNDKHLLELAKIFQVPIGVIGARIGQFVK